MRAALLLLLSTVIVHGSVLVRVDWSGTEAFRSLIAHGMVESGNYLVPRLGGELMATKPPLFYWALAVSEHVFGLRPVAMRLPSLLALWLCACAVHGTLRRRVDRRTAWIAALGLLCAPVIVWHGAFAEIDPLFAALTAVSIVWLAEAIGWGGRGRFVAAGLVGSLAMLAKGPPYLMFLAGVLVPWFRHARLRGLLLFLIALVVPFAGYYLVLTRAPGGIPADELAAVAKEESVGRIVYFDAKSLRDIPLHLLRAVVLTLPLGLFWWTRRPPSGDRAELLRRACLWSYAVAVLVLVVFPARPVRYLLPGIMLTTVALAWSVSAYLGDPAPPRRGQLAAIRGLGAFAALAVVVLPWLPFPLPGWSWIGATAVGLGALFVATRLHVVAFAIVVPVVALWAVGADRERYMSSGVRSDHELTQALREEIDTIGAHDVEVWVFVPEAIALELDPSIEWKLRGSEPDSDWIVTADQDGAAPLELPEGFVERSRVRGRRRDIVLAERVR